MRVVYEGKAVGRTPPRAISVSGGGLSRTYRFQPLEAAEVPDADGALLVAMKPAHGVFRALPPAATGGAAAGASAGQKPAGAAGEAADEASAGKPPAAEQPAAATGGAAAGGGKTEQGGQSSRERPAGGDRPQFGHGGRGGRDG
ncbi:hypothetical protein [uncultured Piscinibacter sp.]|uniref:hypothetical protein n=1 Tax=uncultured Piscinibacter sp. TaxID=1131835 RepID=UPI002626CCF8|nr:hypothetical protein [uncultured Piscinibacter sp.]